MLRAEEKETLLYPSLQSISYKNMEEGDMPGCMENWQIIKLPKKDLRDCSKLRTDDTFSTSF
jgi:hypothetical protein